MDLRNIQVVKATDLEDLLDVIDKDREKSKMLTRLLV